jgi:hypothetical protein
MRKPTHFTRAEGGIWEPVECAIEALACDVLLSENRVFAVRYDDGSIYDRKVGWRPNPIARREWQTDTAPEPVNMPAEVPQTKAPEDRWRHRSASMRCKTCIWFVPKLSTTNEDSMLGRCRRHAPKVSEGWPAVLDGDWCGDHKFDEEKL